MLAAMRTPGFESPKCRNGVGTTIAGAVSQIAEGMRRMKRAVPDGDVSFQLAGASSSRQLPMASGQAAGSSRRVTGSNCRSPAARSSTPVWS